MTALNVFPRDRETSLVWRAIHVAHALTLQASEARASAYNDDQCFDSSDLSIDARAPGRARRRKRSVDRVGPAKEMSATCRRCRRQLDAALAAALRRRVEPRARGAKKKLSMTCRNTKKIARELPSHDGIAQRATKNDSFCRREARLRGRAWLSKAHSPPADWPCRRWPSSPDRRTIRASSAWPAPARPCRDLRRSPRRSPLRSRPCR